MLLEKPFIEVLNSGKPDFPFCLCWANENWTRRWDGLESEILIKQNYEKYDSEEHINWLLRAFQDNRYIRINDKPLFLIYRPDSIPNLGERIKLWRKILKEKGFNDIYLCSVKSFHNSLTDDKLISMGFDALVEFYPGKGTLPNMKFANIPRFLFNATINKLITILGLSNKIKKLPITLVYNYRNMVRKILKKPVPENKTFPCVMPSWDNTARKRWSMVIQNNSIESYKDWLNNSFNRIENFEENEKIIFINAWNEWAEGCHLEPDLKNGKKYLEVTQEIIDKKSRKDIQEI